MPEATNLERRSRRRWIVQGAVFGLLASLLVFTTVGLLRRDADYQIVTTYTRADEPDLGTHRLTTIWVYDVQQSSTVSPLVSPWGDRYVSLTGGLAWSRNDDREGEAWVGLEEFEFSLYAVDTSERQREELVPSERGDRALDRIGGMLQARDPFWFWVTYEPPTMELDHFEIDIQLDGEDHTFALTEAEQ